MHERSTRRRLAAGLTALAAALAPLLVAAEPGVTVRATELRASPATDAKSLGSLAAQAQVDVVKREGAWVQVKSAGATGWLRLFDVRLASSGSTAAKPAGASSLSQTLALAAGTRSTTATTGVRGLDEAMLQGATPNLAELASLDGFAVSPQDAQAFAAQGNLATRTVEPLKTAGSR